MPNASIRSLGKARRFALTPLTAAALLAAASCTPLARAAQPASRLKANADLSARAALPQGVDKRLTTEAPEALEAGAQLGLMSLVLSPSTAQAAALDQLLADQQNPASPRFHQWLTPQQFGDSFGASDADLKILKDWLASQGLTVVDVAPSRNAIQFTGNAGAAANAFQTGFARFHNQRESWYSNTSAPSVPAAFQGIVGGVHGLNGYRLQPHAIVRPLSAGEQQKRLDPSYTTTSSNGTVTHELTPGDIRQIYSGTSLYNAGYTGTGITIAVIGQTAVNTTQLGYFQTLTGQTVKAPNIVLVPNTGTSTTYSGDESEAEADLEFASGVAPGATINYVYTGNGNSSGVFTALAYAVQQNLGQIITLSYGNCEAALGSFVYTLDPYLKQAAAQGQSFFVASGDAGAADCDATTQSASYDGLAVDYPASSAYATGVGGTSFNDTTGTYWSTTNSSQNSSALGYIPESAWNETNSSGLSSGGGGSSSLFGKPAWQTGRGVPADNARDVPDVAFAAAAGTDPYVFCTADPSNNETVNGRTYTGQCTSSKFGDYVVGGTSLAAPSFAGLVALVEQANGNRRLGNINPLLYSLAASTPSVFNDVTSGNNQIACVANVYGCTNGVVGYAAGAGYDRATGLGSVNAANLSANLPSTANAVLRTATLSLGLSSQNSSAATFNISIGGASAAAAPTGTIALTFNNGTSSTYTVPSNGAFAYSASLTGLASGTYTLTAVYSGDTNYAAASATASVVVLAGTPGLALTASPTSLTVTSGSSVKGAITLAATNYTGLVLYTVAGANNSTFPGCFVGGDGEVGVNNSSNNQFLDSSITSGTSATFSYTYYANSTTCASLLSKNATPTRQLFFAPRQTRSSNRLPLAAFAFGGLALSGIALRRRRILSATLLCTAFLTATAGLSGCGSGTAPLANTPSPTTTGAVAKGTYNLVFTATSYTNTSLSSSTNVTVVVQ